jgi:hypothetical protein
LSAALSGVRGQVGQRRIGSPERLHEPRIATRRTACPADSAVTGGGGAGHVGLLH